MRQFKWSLLAAYFAACIAVYPGLPARFPFHFGLNGMVDRWTDKTLLTWLMLPLLMTGLMIVMDLTTAWTTAHPQLWNVPEKQKFLALTEEQRQPVYAELRKLLDLVGIGMLLLFAGIQYVMYSVARQSAPHASPLLPVLIIGFILLAFGYSIAFSMRLRRLILSADQRNSVGHSA